MIEGFYGSMPLLSKVCFFKPELKVFIRHRQHDLCDMCGEQVFNMSVHHKVPRNALKGCGIIGNEIESNGVALCKPDHRIADDKAIHERLFWNGESFVPLESIPKETYRIIKFEPRKQKRYRHR